MALPLGIHGVADRERLPARAADDGRDTLVDCGIAAATTPDGDPGPDGTAALEAALRACGSALERIERLVVTHAHIDHFGLAGEVVRRSGGELWMHRQHRAGPGQVRRPRRGRRPARADAGRPRPLRPRADRDLARAVRLDAGDALDRPARHAARRRGALRRRRPDVGGRAHPGPLARPRLPVERRRTGCCAPATTCCRWCRRR